MNLAPRKLGGAERWMLELAREARDQGHQIHFATHQPALDTWLQQVRGLGATWGILRSLGSSVLEVRDLFQARFDVVEFNLLGPRSMYAFAAYGARQTGVVFVDRVSDSASDDDLSPARKLLLRCADRVSIEFIDRYVGISRYVTNRSIGRFGGKRERYRTIYNGVDVERYVPQKREGARVQVAAVAHLIPEKGVAHLLEACSTLRGRDFHLSIVGEGPQRTHLEHYIREHGIDKQVCFLGLRDDVNVILGKSDIFVHPASWNEAFGYTVAEAMSAGCAVVASNVGALPELLADSSGILVPPGSPSAIASALIDLLENASLREQLGSAARARARKKFDVRDSAAAHISICESVVGHS